MALAPTLAPPQKNKTKPVEPISGEEFAAMGDVGRAELVEGIVFEMPPPGLIHGLVEVEVARLLGNFVREKRLGYVVGGETGFYTRRKPDTVRAVDVAFISNERMAQRNEGTYLNILPELIVEVLSPNDRWVEVAKKLDEYFAVGALQVWIVEPEEKLVYVYTSPTHAVRSVVGDTIADVPFLPGLTIAVQEIFDVLPAN